VLASEQEKSLNSNNSIINENLSFEHVVSNESKDNKESKDSKESKDNKESKENLSITKIHKTKQHKDENFNIVIKTTLNTINTTLFN